MSVDEPKVEGIPARLKVRIPPWLAEALALDIENILTFLEQVPREQRPLYPLHLRDFGKDLRRALGEAREES